MLLVKDWLAVVPITLAVLAVFALILRWTRFRNRNDSGCSCHGKEIQGTCSGRNACGSSSGNSVPEGFND